MKRSAAITLLVVASLALADDWKEVQDTEGVKVFSRSLPDRLIRSVKGTGIVDAPVAKVALVLLDDARAPEWVSSLAEARVVRQLGPAEYVEYNHVSMPLIVSDREFVTRVTMSVDREKRTVVIRSVPADDTEVKKTEAWVRGSLSALYVLESIDEGKRTRLTVEVDADPKGALPPFIVNFFQKDWSRDTIKGIRNQAKKPDLKVPVEFAEFLDPLDF
ncbi:MAG: START domain-containing protein [Archangium sp.]|nr:START domain-containing protein [Archangium sp.]MDP3152734.1 START domain-containing protein [Archangium sp.]MDP3573521.1 START domain-containing protein [Archangium sp.]